MLKFLRIKGIEQFGLDSQSLENMEKELRRKYGVDYNIDMVRNSIWYENQYSSNCELLLPLLCNLDSYERDIETTTYMQMKYCESREIKQDTKLRNLYQTLISDDEETEKGKKGRWDKKILNTYPFIMSNNGMTTEWCYDFQKEMFTFDNLEIFNINKKPKDISRYGFVKARSIYNQLISTPIENILFFDKTLDFSFTNCLFGYLEEIDSREKLDSMEKLIKKIAQLPCTYLRNEITNIVFSALKFSYFSEVCIKDAESIIEELLPSVIEFYDAVLKIVWCSIIKNYDIEKSLFEDRTQDIREWWNCYYDDEKPYYSILENKNAFLVKEAREKISYMEIYPELFTEQYLN